MKLKTSALEGVALDWMVTTCEGGFDLRLVKTYDENTAWEFSLRDEEDASHIHRHYLNDFSPSTNRDLGGEIVERDGIAIRKTSKGIWYAMLSDDLGDGESARWSQFTFRNVPKTASTSRPCLFEWPTPLVAALRCFVASKLGAEVEVPDELVESTRAQNQTPRERG